MRGWYNKPLASATLVAVPPGGKNAELDPNQEKKVLYHTFINPANIQPSQEGLVKKKVFQN
jgi:hypothetical protein